MTKTKPVQEIRLGSIKATIWENSVGDGTRYNVNISRLYKDGEEWKSTESFGREDLLLVAKVADRAHTWIFEHPPAKEPTPARSQWPKPNGPDSRTAPSAR